MRKITRSGLKAVVKECLVEILSEGLNTPDSSTISEGKRKISGKYSQERSKVQGNENRRPSLDHVRFDSTRGNAKGNKNLDLDRNIKNTVSQMTSDDVLSSILEDTARTTLQEQISAESGGRGLSSASQRQGDAASKAMASADPLNVFGDASSKWADLAFSDPVNNKNQ